MSRVIDITEKLDFEGSPEIKIKGETLQVRDDAETVLKLIGIHSSGEEIDAAKMLEMYELIFSPEDREKVKRLGLNYKGLLVLIQTAMSVITGNGDETPGE